MTTENKDWRIGLSVKVKYRNHPRYYERGKIVDVLPSGTGGLVDADGILVIETETGAKILERADDWMSA